MLASFVFSEVSPNAPGSAASRNAVGGAASYLPLGVAGPLDDYDALQITAELQGGNGGTLDVYVQTSPDQGVTWYDFVHFATLASNAAVTPFAVTASLYTQAVAPVLVGKNLTPALAAATFVSGAFSDRVRLLFVAGAGTVAGRPQKVTVLAQRTSRRRGSR